MVQTVARWPKASAVAIVIVGDRRMRKLNHAYRGVDEVTDVLTFRYSRTAGDVVICYPQARRQAKAKQTSLRRECA
ncbi:MAG: rRNA maturation RNase YbeY, partial [Chloroflexi bacterium]|nr:rRNA maturation RNase YbeY [Chloroflexota bacterium]